MRPGFWPGRQGYIIKRAAQATCISVLSRRRLRRMAMPMPPKPRSISAQVPGSGTAPVPRTRRSCLNVLKPAGLVVLKLALV